MNKRKVLRFLFKTPLSLLTIASIITSIYASTKNIGGINYSTPIILTIIFVLYIIGEFFIKPKPNMELKGGFKT